ncbi:amino acid transporter AVT6A isoform X2 [Spinacia oleracea]|uniref:Amino acid transporter AVT6A isoform X2 n=1 Tax=Spinacia oleracea TaxID=3562 RepID=A0ABM3RU29_SPIOL|nr:amino acid transporter AVT6A-like isoform X2 [Spinacia oleracea]
MSLMSATAGDRSFRRGPKTPLLPENHYQYDKHYHPHHHGTEHFEGFDGASFSGAVFNLSTTIVGAGIMALPATFKQLGLIPGVTLIILAALLTEFSIDMILRFSKASKSTSYASVAGDSFGVFGRTISQVCIIVNNLGMLVVYLIIIGDVLAGTWTMGLRHRGLMEEWFGQQWWWTSRSILLLLTTCFVIAPLISFKRVDSLRYTSALSVGLAVVFVAITAGVTIVKMLEGTIKMPPLFPELVDQAAFWKLFTTIPILVTAYICHHNVHPIENELTDPSQMKSIVRTSLILCSSVYVATSFFGFLLFGEQTLDDVLANFDGDLGVPYSSLLDDVIRVSYGVHLMLVFPIVFYSLRLNVDGLLFPHAIPIGYDNKRFYSLTACLMGFIFLGANSVPSIWDAFQFTGATATISVGYIFPAAIALSCTRA